MYDPNGQPPQYTYPAAPPPQGYAVQQPPPGYAVQQPPPGYAVQQPPPYAVQPETSPNQVNYAVPPNQVNYAVPPNQVNYTATPGVQPVYAVQQPPVYTPVTPVVVQTQTVAVARTNDTTVGQGEANSALIIFVCGFFCTIVWLFGFMYVRSKNSTARTFGIMSVVFFFIIVAIVVVVVAVLVVAANNVKDEINNDYSYTGSYTTSTGSYYPQQQYSYTSYSFSY